MPLLDGKTYDLATRPRKILSEEVTHKLGKFEAYYADAVRQTVLKTLSTKRHNVKSSVKTNIKSKWVVGVLSSFLSLRY